MAFFEKQNPAVAQINKQISDNLEFINTRYTEIGRYVKLNLADKIEDMQVKSMIADIDASLQNLKQLNDQLRIIKGVKICPICNNEIEINVGFCPFCGTKQNMPVKNNVPVVNNIYPQTQNMAPLQNNGFIPQQAAPVIPSETTITEPQLAAVHENIETATAENIISEPATEEKAVEEIVNTSTISDDIIVDEALPDDIALPEENLPEVEIPAEDTLSEEIYNEVVPEIAEPAVEETVDEENVLSDIEDTAEEIVETTDFSDNTEPVVQEEAVAANTEITLEIPVVEPERNEPVQTPAFIFCPQCGSKEESDSKFCSNCGTKLI